MMSTAKQAPKNKFMMLNLDIFLFFRTIVSFFLSAAWFHNISVGRMKMQIDRAALIFFFVGLVWILSTFFLAFSGTSAKENIAENVQ